MGRYSDCRIIAADTVVDFQGGCVLKPRDLDQAREFLRMFSGRDQVVYTGVGFYTPGQGLRVEVVESKVLFRELSDKDIDEYVDRVNPLDKAGAYDIDQSGDLLIARIEGSRTNVMGLPRELVRAWLDGSLRPQITG